jgi:hypothetical protein
MKNDEEVYMIGLLFCGRVNKCKKEYSNYISSMSNIIFLIDSMTC